MSKRNRRYIDAAYHDLPGPLAGWYWTCGCDECRASTEWHFYGPFKTKRRAWADGVKDSANSAAPVLVTMRAKRVGETPTQIAYEMDLANVRTATREWRDKANRAFAEASFESLAPSGLNH
jgi:hypothetical protein